MACTLCADVGSYVRRFPTRYTSKMKLVVALALAAAMPSAQAMGKYKVCDDSTQCARITDNEGGTVPTNACQSVRGEATTPNGAGRRAAEARRAEVGSGVLFTKLFMCSVILLRSRARAQQRSLG